ncbi:hypothetical protein FCIRC_11327 [Fusarium circinatum]|uniref:Uncharacterized protein n=1 Tax=Fusarium circinatum TaxID=48490 RepID=A0A8H5T5L7_FUSCI|nr:hypothetical protein FCIRC_11327 [Fusarium circinatum]
MRPICGVSGRLGYISAADKTRVKNIEDSVSGNVEGHPGVGIVEERTDGDRYITQTGKTRNGDKWMKGKEKEGFVPKKRQEAAKQSNATQSRQVHSMPAEQQQQQQQQREDGYSSVGVPPSEAFEGLAKSYHGLVPRNAKAWIAPKHVHVDRCEF